MNKADRARLAAAYKLLDEAKAIIEEIGEGEQEKFDNMTEGLQASERGQRMEEVATELSDAASTLDDIMETVESAQE